MFKKIKQKYIELGLTRYYRIERYLRFLEDELTLPSSVEKNQAKELRELIDHRIKTVKRLTKITVAIYIAIYFSIISFFVGDLVFVQEIATIISIIVSLFGTTVFIIIAYFLNQITELHYQDLNLLTSHLISLYNSRGNIESIDEIEKKLEATKLISNYFKKK